MLAAQLGRAADHFNAYAWGGHYQIDRGYAADGLNRYSAAGGVTPTYDSRGNTASAGGAGYDYDSTNQLVASTSAVLPTDPAGRLFAIGTSAGYTYLLNSGDEMIGEYSSSGAILRRYVFGPGTDEPLVWYEGSGTSDRRWYHADERGSVIAVSNGSGAVTNINSYDEFGIPASGNTGRFQYTGQQWIAELGMQYSRNRFYSPTLGRFIQTDPIGTAGGINIYGYTGNDPVNLTDPSGLEPGYCVQMDDDGQGCSNVGVGGGGCDEDESNFFDLPNGLRRMCLSTGGYIGGPGRGGNGVANGGESISQLGQCVFPGSGIRVSWSGAQVNISGKIQFFDAPGGWATLDRSDNILPLADLYLKMINDDWTGNFGPWSISTHLTLEPGGLSAFVGAGSGMASPGHRWMWLPATSPGAVNYFFNRRVIRGEFGHHLGLLHQDNEALNRGIMQRNHQGDILPEHIDTIIRTCPR